MMIKMMSICCNSIYKNMELAQQKICDLTEKKEFKSCNKDHDDGHNGDEYEDIIVLMSLMLTYENDDLSV